MDEDKVQGCIFFIRNISERQLAEYIVRLSDAIDGLNKNNASFILAYNKMLSNCEHKRKISGTQYDTCRDCGEIVGGIHDILRQ